MKDERTAEEDHLSQAFNEAEHALRHELGSDDERTLTENGTGERELRRDEVAIRQNGGISGSTEDGDLADAEVDDSMDDDMMDKISSSPSIDDGRCSLPSITWPVRTSSLSPNSTPTRSTPTRTRDNTPIHSNSSSPFTATPRHLPLCIGSARREQELSSAIGYVSSSLSFHNFSSQSSVNITMQEPQARSEDHHRDGEYIPANDIVAEPGDDHLHDDCYEDESQDVLYPLPIEEFAQTFEERLANRLPREDSAVLDIPDINEVLLPEDDPLLDISLDDNDELDDEGYDDNGSDSSWRTESECSWDEENDDDSNDISFSDDPRFIDSGWGGECLRETEDIDFEFVYALHTFVATVEGQANATKGDTMVLLDDSNSYWWLVRIVKDSSIGRHIPSNQKWSFG